MLPDEEAWENDYVQLVFDGEPTDHISHLRDLPPEQRRAYAGARISHSPPCLPYRTQGCQENCGWRWTCGTAALARLLARGLCLGVQSMRRGRFQPRALCCSILIWQRPIMSKEGSRFARGGAAGAGGAGGR